MIDSSVALHLIALRGSVIVGPAQTDREENGWVTRAIAGEESAYRWLLSRYRERVVRVAAATLGGTAEAEDAAQEAFIRAFRSLNGLEKKTSFYGWVSKITVRVCLDAKRLKRSEDVSLTDTLCHSHCADRSSSTVETLLVWQVLSQLSPSMRAALVLRELDGLEYDEIGRALNIPIGTVKSRLNAARAKFKELWEEASCDEVESKC
jgi:RNA polymerase sigma-70 factor, ECF subfamily